jgi:hypothetical protein
VSAFSKKTVEIERYLVSKDMVLTYVSNTFESCMIKSTFTMFGTTYVRNIFESCTHD